MSVEKWIREDEQCPDFPFPACQKADAARHVLECSIIPKLGEIATKHDINVDLLKLTLSLIVRRTLEERRAKMNGTKESASEVPVAPWWCIQELSIHSQVFDKNWVKCVSAAAKDMSEILPETLATSGEEIVNLACRINTNAHSLSDDEERATDTAFGLFPMGSLFFRHSCAPNCHFTADKGMLTYRTVRPIKAGEELLISHIELFQPRALRKQELMTTKQIRCDCVRCRTPLRKSVDRFLDGVLCDQCHTGVYLSESEYPEIYPKEEGEEKKAENDDKQENGEDKKENGNKPENGKKEGGEEVKENGEDAKEGEEKKELTEEEKKAAEEDAAARAEMLKKEVRCDHCGHTRKLFEVEMLRLNVQRDYQQIFQLVTAKNHPAVIQYFRLFLDKYQGSRLLHPYHVHLVNAHLPLLTSYKALGDHAACLPIVKHLINVYENTHIVAPTRHEFVELYQELGNVLSALTSGSRAETSERRSHRAAGEVIEKRYKREAIEAYRKAYEVSRVAFGEDGAKTIELRKKARV